MLKIVITHSFTTQQKLKTLL